VPLWIAEQETFQDEAKRIDAGADPRDLSERSQWRETTDVEIQEALEMYGTFLAGQTNGMNDALSLPAVAIALDLEEIPREDRSELTRRLFLIHTRALEIAEARHRKAKHG